MLLLALELDEIFFFVLNTTPEDHHKTLQIVHKKIAGKHGDYAGKKAKQEHEAWFYAAGELFDLKKSFGITRLREQLWQRVSRSVSGLTCRRKKLFCEKKRLKMLITSLNFYILGPTPTSPARRQPLARTFWACKSSPPIRGV